MPFDPLITFKPGTTGAPIDVGDEVLILAAAAGRPLFVFVGPHKLPEWTAGITLEEHIIYTPEENKIQFLPNGAPDAEIRILATTTEVVVPDDPGDIT